jgi:23S rRNA-/tRNA-specific pseudouridylate synthase
MAVHGGPGVLRDLSGELKKLKLGYYEVPQLAHRLDRDTSGVLILSRHPHAAQMLAQWFHNHLIKKIYWAVVIGRPNKIIGTIQVPIGYKNSGRHGFRVSHKLIVIRQMILTKISFQIQFGCLITVPVKQFMPSYLSRTYLLLLLYEESSILLPLSKKYSSRR